MRKRTAAGGIVVVAAVVGLWLSGLFKGFGPGGTGEGDGDGPAEHRAEVPTSLQTRDDDNPPLSSDPAQVVEVLIDGEQYSVRRAIAGGAAWRPADLDEIARLAESASGDAQGVRVRVRRRSTALPSAEQQLEEALLQAGLAGTEVHKVEEIAP
ncbi:MAG TPA: hypothetical protein VML55_10030 [Planctomycetaceae bacterium]|nr:hypothetical protein [Planctomycetaceae bacterium]